MTLQYRFRCGAASSATPATLFPELPATTPIRHGDC
jgi:hypothetical protein